MNYLAHVVLSGDDPWWQLGGYLGDFVKGPLPQRLEDRQGDVWPGGVLEGIRLHRRVDACLDGGDGFRRALARFPAGQRRVAGIALDIVFDHLLVTNWEEYSAVPLAAFNRRFYDFALQRLPQMPERAARFMFLAAQHDLFAGYGESQRVRDVIVRVSQRLTFDSELVAAGNTILGDLPYYQQLFRRTFPALQSMAEQFRTTLTP